MKVIWSILILSFFYSSNTLTVFGQNDTNSSIEIITQQKIQGLITSLTYSPDGSLLACGSESEYSIKIWDLNSGKIIGKLDGHDGETTALSFNKDGTTLISSSKDNKIILWDLISWQIKDSISMEAPIREFSIDASKDNAMFGVSDDGQLIYWESEKLQKFKPLYSANEHFTRIKQHKDQVIIGDKKGNLHIYSISKNESLRTKQVSRFSIIGIDIHPQNQALIVASSNGKIQLLSPDNLNEIRSINASILPISAIDINPSSEKLVTVGQNSMIKVWNLNGELLKEYSHDGDSNPNQAPIKAIKISPDGSTMATSGYRSIPFTNSLDSKNVIHIWDLTRGTLYRTLEGKVNPIYAFDFHPEQNKLATLGRDRKLTFWDFNLAEKYGEIELQEPKRELAGMRKPNTENITLSKVNKFRRVVERVSEGDLSALKGAGNGKGKEIGLGIAKRMFKERDLIRFSKKGSYLITKLEQDEIRLYDLKESRPNYLQPLFSYQISINQIQTSPDEKFLAVIGSGDSAVSIIDLSTKKFLRKLSTPAPTGNFKYLYEANSMAFSPDGTLFAVCFNTGKTFVFNTTNWDLIFENSLPDNLGYVESPFVNFTKDGQFMIVKTMLGLRKYTTKNFDLFSTTSLKIDGYSAPIDQPENYAITVKDNLVYFENIINGSVVESIHVQPNQITNISINPNGMVGITFTNGQFRLINPKTGKEEVLLVADGDNYIFKTVNNYYKVSKEGYDLVTFRIGNRAYPFEQFDAIFNRPDLVLKNMGCQDDDLIQLYEKAYQKRIKKLGIRPTKTIKLEDIPTTKITNLAAIPAITSKEKLQLEFQIEDRNNLSNYNIWVNNVPFYGKKGQMVSGNFKKIQSSIPLVHGLNKIQIACQNSNGYESLIQTFYVEKEGPLPTRDLYLVTIGTSDYQDDRYDLNYPVKDANDLATLFSQNTSGIYNKIITQTLTNEAVTNKNVLELKSFLSQAKANDVVVVFVAGHGVLDANFDYYFGTFNIDFNAPEKAGLAYEKLEQIIDGINANKKILIMDTCHSGEVDKEEVFFSENESSENNKDISFRSVGPQIGDNSTDASPGRLSSELFNDLRKGTGATVISSAGGAEFAMESEEWKNGLFTYCLLNGLKNRTADLNQDGKIMLLELQSYVVEKVKTLSHGRQIPNTRIKNLELDFQIW